MPVGPLDHRVGERPERALVPPPDDDPHATRGTHAGDPAPKPLTRSHRPIIPTRVRAWQRRPPQVRHRGRPPAPRTGLTPAARRGYGLGSVATGSFGTVPGLLLLPYLTDRLGVTAGRRGPGRLPAQGLGRHPQPGRGSDQRPLDQPRWPPPPVPHPLRHPAGAGVRAALRRPDLPDRPRHHLGGRALHRLRHRLRVLPGAVRRDARRDDRRLRRAHPADDLAGGDPRPDHPGQRRPVTRHPQRARAGVGLPRRRPVRRHAHPDRHGRRLVGHPQHPR